MENRIENRAEVEKIKEIIADNLKTDGIETFQVYLFGSRARGDFSSESDYDIMLVPAKRLVPKEKIRLFSKLNRALAKNRYNVDIVIKSPDEVNYYRSKVGHIVRSVLREGIII
jgi:predicted nucleotidyltransferase